MTKEEIGGVLKNLRTKTGMTQREVAEKIGRTQQIIGHWETGYSQPDANTLFVLCDIYGVSVDEAFGFKKENVSIARKDLELLDKINSLDPFGKDTIKIMIDRELERVKQIEEAEENKDSHVREDQIIYLPEMYSRFSAGTGQYNSDFGYEMAEVPYSPEAAQANYLITVSGDSMEPDFSNGDRVFIKSMPNIEIGEIGAWQVNGDLFIKEKGNGELISVNPDYDNIKIGEYDEVSCLGKVLGKVNN